MKGKKFVAVIVLMLGTVFCVACGQKSKLSGDGARKVVLGLGNGDGDSIPYEDTVSPRVSVTPTPEPTPTPVVTVTPEPSVTPSVTPDPSLEGSFTEDDCKVMVAGMQLYPGMDFNGRQNLFGTVIQTIEGVSCLDAGKDTNYFYDDFQVCTFAKNGKQIVYSADFTDGKVETSKHIGIGSTEDEMLAAYGVPEENAITRQTYISGSLAMTFLLKDGIITEIIILDQSVN